MNKKLLLTAGILLSLTTLSRVRAQSAGFNDVKGVTFVNAGVGLGSFGLSGAGGLPIVASVEHGFTDKISAGISGSMVQRKYATDWKYSYILFGVRGSYHFNEVLKVANPKLDVYGGAGLLYRHYTVKYKGGTGDDPLFGEKASSGDITLDVHAGGRYMFSEHAGAFAELGYGISPLQLGLTLTF